jgi:hypothetical protein
MGTNVKTINIAEDFSMTPFGRYRTDSKFSAQKFRDETLLPALRANDVVIIELDGTSISYGSSFLEETFGGLVRKGITPSVIKEKIKIHTRLEDYKLEIEHYIDRAAKEMEQDLAH